MEINYKISLIFHFPWHACPLSLVSYRSCIHNEYTMGTCDDHLAEGNNKSDLVKGFNGSSGAGFDLRYLGWTSGIVRKSKPQVIASCELRNNRIQLAI